MKACMLCDEPASVEDRFCANCGSPVVEPAVPVVRPEPAPPAVEAVAAPKAPIAEPVVPTVDSARQRLDEAIDQYSAGRISASTLARIEANLASQLAADSPPPPAIVDTPPPTTLVDSPPPPPTPPATAATPAQAHTPPPPKPPTQLHSLARPLPMPAKPKVSSRAIAVGVAAVCIIGGGALIIANQGPSPARRWIDQTYGSSGPDIEYACEIGGDTAAGLDWEPSMDFSFNDLAEAWDDKCG